MVDRYEIHKQDGKWQVFVKEPPKGMAASGWITCQTKADADSIAEAPVLAHKVEDLGERGEDLARGLDVASEAWEFSMIDNKILGTDTTSRHYLHLAEIAGGEEDE